MKIVEKNVGKKIDYELTGTKLDFADGALRIDLARYQRDDAVTMDIMVDNEGYLTTGKGRYYAAPVEIPAIQYEEKVQAASEVTEGEDNENNRDEIIRTPLPINTDDVVLYLFAIDGIVIH
jgi:hypothetical protein